MCVGEKMSSATTATVTAASQRQFCIGVELGDDTLVRDLVQRGAANTMLPYKVDGKLTTPMQSALTKGDLVMTMTLLNSRETKTNLAEINMAPPILRSQVTPLLMKRMTDAMDQESIQRLLLTEAEDHQRGGQRRSSAATTRRGGENMVHLSESLAEYLRKTPSSLPAYNKETMKDRCPSQEAATTTSRKGEEVEDDDERSVDHNNTMMMSDDESPTSTTSSSSSSSRTSSSSSSSEDDDTVTTGDEE